MTTPTPPKRPDDGLVQKAARDKAEAEAERLAAQAQARAAPADDLSGPPSINEPPGSNVHPPPEEPEELRVRQAKGEKDDEADDKAKGKDRK